VNYYLALSNKRKNLSMKRIFLLVLFLITFLTSNAQTKFGITAGAQISSVKIVNSSSDSRLSFNLGGSMLSEISGGVDFHLQLLLSGKGFTIYDSYGYKNIVRPFYFELPANIRFNLSTTKDAKVFLGGGGYLAYGIGGTIIYYNNGYKESQKINFGNTSDDDLENIDMGLVFQFGAAFRENYEGHIFYDMGLKRLVPNSTSNSYNRVFGFNLTWYF